MAKYLIARQLAGKRVVSSDAEDFGRLVDLNINEVTGKIETLVVDPNPNNSFAEALRKEDGAILVPYESVLAISDYILIEKRSISQQ